MANLDLASQHKICGRARGRIEVDVSLICTVASFLIHYLFRMPGKPRHPVKIEAATWLVGEAATVH
jgi:hypothetical protein